MNKTVEVSQAARDAARLRDIANHMTPGGIDRANLDSFAFDLIDIAARFEATTRATQPEAALREAVANIKGIAEAALNFHDCPDCGAVFDVARAALKDHRHG